MIALFMKYTGLSKLAGILAAAAAFMVAVGAILWKARQSGREAERADSLESAVKAARKSGAIDEEVTHMSDADLHDELHNGPRG